MLTIVVTTLLAVLYGLAWHNQPARERSMERRSQTAAKSQPANYEKQNQKSGGGPL